MHKKGLFGAQLSNRGVPQFCDRGVDNDCSKGGGRGCCTSENNINRSHNIVVHQKTTHNGKHLSEEDQSGTAVGRLSKLSQVV